MRDLDLPNTTAPPALTNQRGLAKAWKELVPHFPEEQVHVSPSIEETVDIVRKLEQSTPDARPIQVLTTGSLHLIGGVMNVAGLSEFAM
jgi:folylpolyglutamate synthase